MGSSFVDMVKLLGIPTWILHESEAFICKALKGEAIVAYAEPLITKGAESAIRRIMKASGSPVG
jgi:hypothetical protein